jgi:hypothetical protein
MRISRIEVANHSRIRDLALEVRGHAVIVGAPLRLVSVRGNERLLKPALTAAAIAASVPLAAAILLFPSSRTGPAANPNR